MDFYLDVCVYFVVKVVLNGVYNVVDLNVERGWFKVSDFYFLFCFWKEFIYYCFCIDFSS